jgi:hypothetical protein
LLHAIVNDWVNVMILTRGAKGPKVATWYDAPQVYWTGLTGLLSADHLSWVSHQSHQAVYNG